ncbi:hypothetical protein HUN41_00283 [Streptomyces phage Coruscant]|uniref:Uncharacterized protein n=1 Tax=Streptomyces phage Coruscant TaxID=2739834 RepID=A0A7G4AVV7_9CAUD|nr:hypothetical protein PP454_gp017 [Streptomyces phage Coruscant]YP_010651606.1 hypothetical protein PP454_gp046 [Streptomyces phage Coruscant]QMP84147.1 hypothetical protein HUN41_00017 [Streptomyces phage Coruscant]QMP84371.1 hypothetical protein HUN41_00283 [Streptomyces phage Coruscant]
MIIMNSVARIVQASQESSSTCREWFSGDAMDFFNTQIQNEVHPCGRFGTLFVTLDGPELDERAYTVRLAYHKEGRFHMTTMGEFMAYPTREAAYAAVEIVAGCIGDIVRTQE